MMVIIMEDGFSISMETVLLFLGILFIAFCCGFLRSIKRYFGRTVRRPTPPQRNILVTQIRIPTTSVQLQNDGDISSVFPGDEQLSPPPYSAVSNILPPSYDEAIKQNADGNQVPKADERY